ncbi:MAG: DUF3782 domain-containing protein [Candidatus Competibacteraceae bacterium]
MTPTDLKSQLQVELPEPLKQDAGFRNWLEPLIRQTAVAPESFDARFDRMLQEFAVDRAEQRQRWDEQNRKWDEQNRKNNELLEEIKQSRSRQDQGIGALGARWGIASEHSFRAALL